MDKKISDFIDGQYINIETFKKDGSSVRTPVWYIIQDDLIFIRSDRNSWKVKRIRKNSHVKISKCNMFGKTNSELFDGTASIKEKTNQINMDEFFDKKYGIKNKILKLMYKIKKLQIVIISVKIN